MEQQERPPTFWELPTHERLRAGGHLLCQLGLMLIGVAGIIKFLGNLPDIPMQLGGFGEGPSPERTSRTGSYFEL